MVPTGLFLLMTYISVAAVVAASNFNVKQNNNHLERDDFYYDVFPKDFRWGLGTSSYQVEGAWNLSGESIWDRFTHTNPGNIIVDGSNGDVACDSYHKFEDDVQALKAIRANFYRFSLSWGRILPDGTTRNISKSGMDYYNRLINALLREGIFPVVTLYHWDLPQPLQDIGGWPNPKLAIYFGNYARFAFASFGDRVKHWITFNEPWLTCQLGYGYAFHAPGISSPAELPYQCGHSLLMAHGLAYRIYKRSFKKQQQGEIGISLHSEWFEPENSTDSEHLAASERALQFTYGWFAHPLTFGTYPPIMRELIDAKSRVEGRNESRLPTFSPYWTDIINGSLDFYGLNHYTSGIVRPAKGGWPGNDGDQNTVRYLDPEWPGSAAVWIKVVPWGFRKLLNWISNQYGTPPLYVTENGFADLESANTSDAGRVNYYRLYTNELLKAIKLDGVNVKGYTAWSLLDNFEWSAGYTLRFGVYYINFSDPNLTRVPKNSARFLAKLFEDNGYFQNSTASNCISYFMFTICF